MEFQIKCQQKLIKNKYIFIPNQQRKYMYKLPNGKIVYPEDIQCVHQPINGKGGVWLGNLEAAENLQTLKKNGIKAVLTAAKGVFLNHSKTQIPYQLYIPGEDHEKFDMSKFFAQSANFIKETLERTNILVHCLAGVSRSVSLVMAYFIKFQNMSYEDIYKKIKSKRKIIHPNDGFITQLKIFESQCKENPVYQRNDHHEMRSSYSPEKRYERREFQGYQPSPQKFYQSPEKRYNRYGYLDIDQNQRYIPQSAENVKNPQIYKNIVQQFRKQRQNPNNVSNYQGMKHISPDKYQKENRASSGFGLKRLSSMNVDLMERSNNTDLKRSQILNNYQKYETRGRISSDYKPLDSIQNKDYEINNQIDRKIAEIRKKYQQYTKQPERVTDRASQRLRVQRKYSNISTVQQSNNESMNMDDLMDLKMRKVATDFQPPSLRNDNYVGVSIVRNHNYLVNQAPVSNATKFGGSRLRRLQSYQV